MSCARFNVHADLEAFFVELDALLTALKVWKSCFHAPENGVIFAWARIPGAAPASFVCVPHLTDRTHGSLRCFYMISL